MNTLALFAGPGGTCLGAHAHGIRPLGIEWDDAACATRRAAGLPTLQADVAALTPRSLPCTCGFDSDFLDGMTSVWHRKGCPNDIGPICGLIATPPCQAFSMAGKGAGRDHVPEIVTCMNDLARGVDSRAAHNATCEDDRAMLVVEPLRWALALKPRWITLEQVPPVLPLWEVMGEHLRAVGYSVWTGVLSAEQYGVPQTRRRAFLIASLDGVVHPPVPTHQAYRPGEPATGTPDSLMGPGLKPWVSMAEALGWGFDAGRWVYVNGKQENQSVRSVDEPAPTIIGRHDTANRVWVPTHYDARQTGFRPRPIDEPAPTMQAQGLAKGRDVWSDDPDTTYRRDAESRPVVGGQLPEGEGRKVGGRGWANDRPATTVAGDPRVHPPGHKLNADDEKAGREYDGRAGMNAVRVTVREAAILQGFPPDHPWQGSRTAQFRQIGDAVPPPLAAAVIGAAIAPSLEQKAAA